MKLIHLSDLHIGKRVNEVSMIEDQEYILTQILRIIDEEIPSVEEFEAILDAIEAPKSIDAIGVEPELVPMIFKCTKDFRDKYVLPRLLWDLGVLDEVCEKVF